MVSFRRSTLVFGLSACCLVSSTVPIAASEPSHDAGARRQTYKNPILTDDSPADPDVILVDGTYYLYPTTHGHGYDVWTSTDLVNWKPRGSVFQAPRGGAWAPDVFHNKRGDGKFYLYYTDSAPNAPLHGPFGKQVGVAVSNSPLGPFDDKKVLAAGSIDAHLFQDDDGRLYLYYVEIANGFKIFAQPMTDPLTPTGERVEVLHPTEPWEMISGHVTEGPFMLKHKGIYYLMYSGTGADSPNYGIGYATSKSPMGPFKKFAGNPIAHRSEESGGHDGSTRPRPVQGVARPESSKGVVAAEHSSTPLPEPQAVPRSAPVYGPGHHCVVTGPDGKLWMLYHQKYDDRTNYRRFLALDPIWFDDAGKLHARVTREAEAPAPK
jgi:beta-xylosidase